MTLGAPVTWAIYTAAAKPLLEKYSAVKITAYSMLAGCAPLLPLSLPGLLGLVFDSKLALYWLMAAISVVVVLALVRLDYSRFGLTAGAIREG